MAFIIECYVILLVFLGSMNITSSDDPDMSPFMNEITTNLFVLFDNSTKEEKPSSVLDIMNSSRRQFMADMHHVTHYGNMEEKIIACYYTAVTYRSAMWDLRRYFEIRYLYTKTLEFEVGYLCHEIIFRYQLLLELYQMVERRLIGLENRNFAPLSYVFYIYTNILEQSKVIIHLCHMLNEIEKKYKGERGVFDDYGENRVSQLNTSSIVESKAAYERWLQRKRQEERKRAKERKKYMKQLHKFGMTTSRKRTTAKKSSWPLQYGWSIEDW